MNITLPEYTELASGRLCCCPFAFPRGNCLLLALCLFAGLHISKVNGAALWDSAGVVVTRLLQVGLCHSLIQLCRNGVGTEEGGWGGESRMGKPGGAGGGGGIENTEKVLS